ncbi:hypothetical protein G4D82_10975 [Flavobacterium sp. CYK-4]|uniref:hypothetical protein n=1 Tax=Flavobacterium lotistagni TaxID=2709660 RepID=UPI00140DA5A4|nr:hypothetical protein [Flavobacterium lotistagni]NHM07747.1 hypothetical protein [Flavobacterium lotistagni]
MSATKSENRAKISSALNIAYFGLAFVQILTELFDFFTATTALRIVSPILLLFLYLNHESKKEILFYLTMILLLLSNLFCYCDGRLFFLWWIVVFILLRMVTLALILKLTVNKNYLHIIVASFPFLVIFFYLISATTEIPEYEFNLLILITILISLLGGVSAVNYFKNDNRKHSWLLISTLLFVGYYFIILIEHYFTSNLDLMIYKPIEIVLNIFAFYTFYKYVTAAETDTH